MTAKKILVLGVTGMLGHTLFTELTASPDFDVYGTCRNQDGLSRWLAPELLEKVTGNVDANRLGVISDTLNRIKPDVVINCIGVIKQLESAKDPIATITINSLFPHQIAKLCESTGSRMIHISTDCVFSGNKGNYTETDQSDAEDLYGRTKFLGEVDCPNCVTLRTSIIGHELTTSFGLVEWFLSQAGKVRGFTNAIYTGFSTIEIVNILTNYVIPDIEIKGLHQVSSDPISKFDLLRLVAEKYGKQIEIEPYHELRIDRSLNSSRFRQTTGYNPPSWPELIDKMHLHYKKSPYYQQFRR